MFRGWLMSDNPQPYNSFGNGSAMRVSPVGWAFDSLEEDDLELAHTVMPDGSLLYTQGKRTGMIFHPFTEQELSELLGNKEILYRRTNTKWERVLVVRNSPAVYK